MVASLIDKIPDSNQYKADLQKYCLIISYLGRTATGDKTIQDEWETLDPESYKELNASNTHKW